MRKEWEKYILIVIGALGYIPKELNKWTEEIGIKPSSEQLQKTVLLVTARILSNTFDI